VKAHTGNSPIIGQVWHYFIYTDAQRSKYNRFIHYFPAIDAHDQALEIVQNFSKGAV
jgi:hypothetical protein